MRHEVFNCDLQSYSRLALALLSRVRDIPSIVMDPEIDLLLALMEKP